MTAIEERITWYFPDRGKNMMENTIMRGLQRCNETGIEKFIIFTSDGNGPLFAARNKNAADATIVAVTFPAGQVFRDSKGDLVRTKLSDPVEKKRLRDKGIVIVQGTMPLQEVITHQDATTPRSTRFSGH